MAMRIALLLAIVLAVVVVQGARPAAGQIRESAERLAREAGAAQLTSSRRVTSQARVTTGLIIAAAGAGMVYYAWTRCAAVGPDAGHYDPPLTASYNRQTEECELSRRTTLSAREVYALPARDMRLLSGGVGAAAFGVALAWAWSDVDANNSVTFDLRPDGVGVAKRIGW